MEVTVFYHYQTANNGTSWQLKPRLHHTGLHRSVVIFIPDSVAVCTIPH